MEVGMVGKKSNLMLLAFSQLTILVFLFGSYIFATKTWRWNESQTILKKPSRLSTKQSEDSRHLLDSARGNNPIALLMGLPKSGTTSLAEYFRCGNLTVTHWVCENDPEKIHHPQYAQKCADCIKRNAHHHQPTFNGCGENVDVYAQMDDPNGYPRFCFFPQVELMNEIHKWYPNVTFILNLRNPDDWLHSLNHWHGMRGRLVSCNITGLPTGVGEKDEDLLNWYTTHSQNVRDFVKQHPSHELVEYHIEQGNPQDLVSFFGIPSDCYGQYNHHPELRPNGGKKRKGRK